MSPLSPFVLRRFLAPRVRCPTPLIRPALRPSIWTRRSSGSCCFTIRSCRATAISPAPPVTTLILPPAMAYHWVWAKVGSGWGWNGAGIPTTCRPIASRAIRPRCSIWAQRNSPCCSTMAGSRLTPRCPPVSARRWTTICLTVLRLCYRRKPCFRCSAPTRWPARIWRMTLPKQCVRV